MHNNNKIIIIESMQVKGTARGNLGDNESLLDLDYGGGYPIPAIY